MKRVWDTDELTNVWGLSYEELQLLKTKPSRNHLGFSIQLKCYQYIGRFIKCLEDIPEPPLIFLADQLDVSVKDIEDYDWDSRTGKRHRSEILSFLGITRLTTQIKEAFSKWLVDKFYPQGQTVTEARELAYYWFKNPQTESPTKALLNRLIRKAINKYEICIFYKIIRSLSSDTKKKMDKCLDGAEGVIEFSTMKGDPGKVGLESILNETDKLQFIKSLNLPVDIIQSITTKTLKRFYQRISGESAWEVKRHPQEIKYGLFTIFLYFRQSEIIDGMIELFIQIVHRLSVRAERKLVKELMSDFQKVHGKPLCFLKLLKRPFLIQRVGLRISFIPLPERIFFKIY